MTHHPLHPETPPGGMTLEELFRGRRVDVAAMHQRMAGLMAAEGLPFQAQSRIPNTRLAQELASWGLAQGNKKIVDALYRGHFAEAKDIGDADTLVAIAEAAGLDPVGAAEVLATRSHRAQIDRDWQRSRDLGVSGVPTFVVGNNGVVGAQPYEVLEGMVVAAGALRRD